MSIRVVERARIEAPCDRVVERLSDFGSIGDWHPAIDACAVEGEGCAVDGEGRGAIRTLKIGDNVVRERLDELGEGGRGYRYTQLEGPLAGTKHRGYLWITEDGDDATVVEWAAKVKDQGLPDAAAEQIMTALFVSGLRAAKLDLELG